MLAVLCREVLWPVAWVTVSHDSLAIHGKVKVVMITAFFWVITQRIVAIPYLRFGTTYRSNLFFLFWTLECGTDRLSRNVGEELPILAT